MALFHGLPGVFLQEHVDTTLETIKQTSAQMTEYGVTIYCKPDASTLTKEDWSPGYMGSHGVHPAGVFMLAMLYIYRGQREFGLDLAKRPMQEMARRGFTFDLPVIIDGELHGEIAPRIGL